MAIKQAFGRVENATLGGGRTCELLGTLAHLTTAELQALYALLVPLGAHATGAGDGSHSAFMRA